MVYAQPGVVPQMSGYLGTHQIWAAAIFANHFSDYIYVTLMRDLTLDETLLAKTAFERHALSGGIAVASYHADNGRFADKGFQEFNFSSRPENNILRCRRTSSKWYCGMKNQKSYSYR